MSGVRGHSMVICLFGFMVFAATSFGVLMVMDNMECFLHALRLHWYSFYNFKGLSSKINFSREMDIFLLR